MEKSDGTAGMENDDVYVETTKGTGYPHNDKYNPEDLVQSAELSKTDELAAAQNRAKNPRRLLKDTTPLQRGIIRHLVLILDLSNAMTEKDLRPNRYLLTIRYASDFVTEYFEENPISQLAILGMRDGIAVRISDMGGNPVEHIQRLQTLRPQDPKGDASLQNALEMARGLLL